MKRVITTRSLQSIEGNLKEQKYKTPNKSNFSGLEEDSLMPKHKSAKFSDKVKSTDRSYFDVLMEEYKDHNALLQEKVKEDKCLLQEKSTLKMRGRILHGLLKKRMPSTRVAFFRWHVRSSPILMFQALERFVNLCEVSPVVCLYKMKFMAILSMKKKEKLKRFVRTINDLIESKIRKCLLNNGFFYVKLRGQFNNKRKMQFLKSIVDKSYRLQRLAINSLKAF